MWLDSQIFRRVIFPLAEYNPGLCLLFQHMIGEMIDSMSFHSQNFSSLNKLHTILRIFECVNFKVLSLFRYSVMRKSL